MSGSTSTATRRIKAAWQPQPGPQQAFVRCPVKEILFGGARGGGKTDATLGRVALRAGWYGQHYNCVVFRREMPQTDDMLERARELYGQVAAFKAHDSSFRFANGARLRFRPLENVRDAEKYQGQNLSDVVIEEAGNFPDPAPIQRLWGAIRSAHQVAASMVLTANPGGPGQQWIADRFKLLEYPEGYRLITEVMGDGSKQQRIFIPARVADNQVLLKSDPDYISRLHMVGSKELVRAWLDGDWSAIAGAFFDCWSPDRHIVPPFEIPEHWLKFRSMDWGSARPTSVGWWAVVSDEHHIDGHVLPRGCLVRYREWYVRKGPNEGQKLTAEQVAQGILERELEPMDYGIADPAIFQVDGGPSIAERMARMGVFFRAADNRRVSQKGALGGWDMMRQRLIGDGDGRPMVVCARTCRDSIRTIPTLQHDDARPEDLDTDGEDHAADEWRYACMSRPWTRGKPIDYDPIAQAQKGYSLEDLFKAQERQR